MAVQRYEPGGDGAVDAKRLAEPLTFFFSKRTLSSRLFKASMGKTLATWDPQDAEACGVPTKELIELYKRQVMSNPGVNTKWHKMGRARDWLRGHPDWQHPDQVAGTRLARRSHIDASHPLHGPRFEAFKQLAAAGKTGGALMIPQLSYAGRQALAGIARTTVMAPSVVPYPSHEMKNAAFAATREATQADIEFLIRGFVHAAVYLEAAGFDGIELHGAHGYVIAQFLSPRTNKRTDAYGGSLTNRMRLLLEIAKGIRARTSPSFVVGVNLNSVELQEGGFTAAEAAEVCSVLQDDAGMDFVELSGGTMEKVGHEWTKETTLKREVFFLKFPQLIVPRLGDTAEARRTKVFITGGLRTGGAMVNALDTVDAVGMARPAAQEPWIARDLLSGTTMGAIRPVPGLENDSRMGIVLAGAQMRQISRGFKPLNSSDGEAVEGLLKDKAADDGAAATDPGMKRGWFPVVSKGNEIHSAGVL